MPKAYIYVRVSTDRQELSPEWQRQVCERYFEQTLAARGYEMGQVFCDIGQSAYKIPWSEREQGRLMFQVVRPGDTIIAAKQDRVWRNTRDRENSLFYLNQMGIHLVILDAQLDTSTAAGKFAAGVIALQAAWESDVRSERCRAFHSVRLKRKTPRRKHPPPGWKWDAIKEEMVPDLRERKLLEMLWQWRLQRVRSIAESCRWLKEEGIKRANGTAWYDHAWVKRAYMMYKRGWPQEGFMERFWKDPSTAPEEKAKYRLPLPEGAKLIHPRYRRRGANAADLRWLAEAYQGELAEYSQPCKESSQTPAPST